MKYCREQLQIITTRSELKSVLTEFVLEVLTEKQTGKITFEEDKINRHQAAELIGVSVTTLDKFVKTGKIKQHSTGGRKKFLLRSEIIEALKNMDE